MTFSLPDPGPPESRVRATSRSACLEETAAALSRRGFLAQAADNASHARRLVFGMIPEGAEVHIALSETMNELGITAEIDESGRYRSIRTQLGKLTERHNGARCKSLVPLRTTSWAVPMPLPMTARSSWVGLRQPARCLRLCRWPRHLGYRPSKARQGPHGALRRLREYSLPKEFQRMQSEGRPGTLLAKTLIIHWEPSARISVILMPETLGF